MDEEAFNVMLKRAGIKPENAGIARKFIEEYEAAKQSNKHSEVSIAQQVIGNCVIGVTTTGEEFGIGCGGGPYISQQSKQSESDRLKTVAAGRGSKPELGLMAILDDASKTSEGQ